MHQANHSSTKRCGAVTQAQRPRRRPQLTCATGGAEHVFPAAVEDALAAVQWTADNAAELGVDPDRVAVAGDSAGGTLSTVVSLLARDAGGPRIAFQMLLYPYLGGSPDSYPSLTDFKDDYGLTEHDKRHACLYSLLGGGRD